VVDLSAEANDNARDLNLAIRCKRRDEVIVVGVLGDRGWRNRTDVFLFLDEASTPLFSAFCYDLAVRLEDGTYVL
jgi:hypothetical protein